MSSSRLHALISECGLNGAASKAVREVLKKGRGVESYKQVPPVILEKLCTRHRVFELEAKARRAELLEESVRALEARLETESARRLLAKRQMESLSRELKRERLEQARLIGRAGFHDRTA